MALTEISGGDEETVRDWPPAPVGHDLACTAVEVWPPATAGWPHYDRRGLG